MWGAPLSNNLMFVVCCLLFVYCFTVFLIPNTRSSGSCDLNLIALRCLSSISVLSVLGNVKTTPKTSSNRNTQQRQWMQPPKQNNTWYATESTTFWDNLRVLEHTRDLMQWRYYLHTYTTIDYASNGGGGIYENARIHMYFILPLKTVPLRAPKQQTTNNKQQTTNNNNNNKQQTTNNKQKTNNIQIAVVCCLLFVVCCLVFGVCCSVFVVGCCLLFAICYLLCVVCCLLFVVCCLLFIVCCVLCVVCCLLFAMCCLLFVVCCLLLVVGCLLFVVCCLLFGVWWLVFGVCCLLFVVRWKLFVVCCVLFVVCCLLCVVCCLLLVGVVCCWLFAKRHTKQHPPPQKNTIIAELNILQREAWGCIEAWGGGGVGKMWESAV